MKNTEWLTLKESMEYLKVKSKSTIYSLQKRYNISVSKPNSIAYFRRRDFDRMLEENAVITQQT